MYYSANVPDRKLLKPMVVASSLCKDRWVWFDMQELKAKLVDADMHVLEEGPLGAFEQHVGRKGMWYCYYPSGKLKSKGAYDWMGRGYDSYKIGPWEEYYPDGKLKKLSSYEHTGEEVFETDLYGSYKEYYNNGKLAVDGLYGWANDFDTLYVVDPTTGLERGIPRRKYVTAKTGTWHYYNKDGTLKYKEDYP